MMIRFKPVLRDPLHTPVVMSMSVDEFIELQRILNSRRVRESIREVTTDKSVIRQLMRGCNRLYNHFSGSVSPGPMEFDPGAPHTTPRGPTPRLQILDEVPPSGTFSEAFGEADDHNHKLFQQEIAEEMAAGLNRRLASDRLSTKLNEVVIENIDVRLTHIAHHTREEALNHPDPKMRELFERHYAKTDAKNKENES